MTTVITLNSAFKNSKNLPSISIEETREELINKLINFEGIMCFLDLTDESTFTFSPSGLIEGLKDISGNNTNFKLDVRREEAKNSDMPIFNNNVFPTGRGCIYFEDSNLVGFSNSMFFTGSSEVTLSTVYHSLTGGVGSEVVIESSSIAPSGRKGNLYFASNQARTMSGLINTSLPSSISISPQHAVVGTNMVNDIPSTALIGGNGYSITHLDERHYEDTVTIEGYFKAGEMKFPGSVLNNKCKGYIGHIIYYDKNLIHNQEFLETLYAYNRLTYGMKE